MSLQLRSALLALLLAAPASAVELIPIGKLDLLGGQFFFEEVNTSFSGNADWSASLGIKLGDHDVLLPTVSGQYRRTREVRELIGGGFITQESLDNSGSLKWIHTFNDEWSVKPSFAFKNELITESEDEDLGKGLFDYNKLSAGLEVEYKGEVAKSVRNSFNAYAVRFYHYSALTSFDIGEEIKSGEAVLDFNAYDYSLAIDVVPREGTVLSLSMLGSYRRFIDQKLVTVTGEFEDDERVDLVGVGVAGLQQRLKDWSVARRKVQNAFGLSASYTYLKSDQHSYDTANTRFNPDYYDYGEVSASPFYVAKFDEKLDATVAYDYTHRFYRKRPIQDVTGVYGEGKIRTHAHTASLSMSYAVWKGLSLKLKGSYVVANSNMKYEKTYRYNYRAAHYFVGAGYSF